MSRESIVLVHGSDMSIPDGATHRVTAFVKALTEANYNVHLVTPKPKGKVPVELHDAKVHIAPVTARKAWTTYDPIEQIMRGLTVLQIAKTIASREKAIIQIEHSLLGGLATLIGLKDFILDVHDILHASPAYHKAIQRLAYIMEGKAVNSALKIIVVSNVMKRFLCRQWKIPREKIVVIPNGYWAEKINLIKNRMKDYECKDYFIARVGLISEYFNVEALIQLAKAVKDVLRVLLVGDGVLRPYLEYRLRKENIKNVTITGLLPYEKSMEMIMKAQVAFECVKKNLTTMLAFPVKIFDYASLEKAMSLAEPSEVSYIFKQRNAALVSETSNIEEFVENILKLLYDEKLRKNLGKRAKELAKEYSWENQGKKLVQFYESYY
jgi:glycosyltransferase involved in cell wall biosynthesis